MVSEIGTGEQSYFRSRYGATAFGAASLLIGIGLLYSIVTDSIDLLLGVLLATLSLTAISLYIVFRQDGVLTTENSVIGVFVLLALGLFFGLAEYTALPSAVMIGAVIVVGVIVPNLLVNYTNLGNE
jgi:hypothetical protein